MITRNIDGSNYKHTDLAPSDEATYDILEMAFDYNYEVSSKRLFQLAVRCWRKDG